MKAKSTFFFLFSFSFFPPFFFPSSFFFLPFFLGGSENTGPHSALRKKDLGVRTIKLSPQNQQHNTSASKSPHAHPPAAASSKPPELGTPGHLEGELVPAELKGGKERVKCRVSQPPLLQVHKHTPLAAPPNALKSHPGFVVFPPRGRNASSPEYKAC